MTPTKVYHIYAKKECLYYNLSQRQFNKVWNTLKGMVGLMETDYTFEDLTYEEVEITQHMSEEHSY
jgi:hypothetical protein